MKNIMLILISYCLCFTTNGQELMGAWEASSISKDGNNHRIVAIFQDGYFTLTTYESTTGKFIHTKGGEWHMEKNTLTEKLEFDSENPEKVGNVLKSKVRLAENSMEVVQTALQFTRIDDGTPGKLNGGWLMSGRKKNEEIQFRDTNGPRKTMKILSGTRFQWIAYNINTKEFMGTGGGTYITSDGKYIENIEFFSKDDSKAGLSLEFDFELKKGNWHHSGLSSKGDPIHEIWSPRL